MAGNTLGPRSKFLYTGDGGVNYVMTMDTNLGQAAGLPVLTAAAAATAQRRPTRFKPRVVFVEAVVANSEDEDSGDYIARKELVVNADSALFNSVSAKTVTIDGVLFTTTGRRGEKLSF